MMTANSYRMMIVLILLSVSQVPFIAMAERDWGEHAEAESGDPSYPIARDRGYADLFRTGVIQVLGNRLVEEKPTRDEVYELDFSDSEYASLVAIINRAPAFGFTLPESERELLRRMVESPPLRVLVALVLVDHREIRDLRTAQDWLSESDVDAFCLHFLHSRMDMPQSDWLPYFQRYFKVIAGSMFDGNDEEVNAFMNLLWCRYGSGLSEEMAGQFFLYTSDFNTCAREVPELRFSSVQVFPRCSSLASSELTQAMVGARPELARQLQNALALSASCWYFEETLILGETLTEKRPRSIWHTEQPGEDPYQINTLFELLDIALAPISSEIQRRVLVSRIRASILHSLEHAEVPFDEWIWTVNGYRYDLEPDIAEARHAYRIARSQAILERLAAYDPLVHEPLPAQE